MPEPQVGTRPNRASCVTGPEPNGPSTRPRTRTRPGRNLCPHKELPPFPHVRLFALPVTAAAVSAISYTVFGIIACILIITIPAGVASFRIAGYVIWPFGREVVPKRDAGTGSVIMNVIWFIFAGLWLCIAHVASALVLCVTIIGIPLAVADIKMIPVCAFPFGKEIVPSGSQEIEIVTY